MARTAHKALVLDAKNRAARTFVQGVAIDVLVAVAVASYAIVSNPKPIVWSVVGASLARTAVQSAASYVMRRFLDNSKVPTPTPPEPADPTAGLGVAGTAATSEKPRRKRA